MRGDRVRNKVGDTVGDKAPRSQNLAHTLGRREKSGHHPCFYRLKSNSFRLLGTNGQHGKHLQSRILQVSAPNLRTNPLVFLSSAFLQKKLSCPIWASKRVSCNNPWTLFWFLVNFGKCGLGLWFLNPTDIDPICSWEVCLTTPPKQKSTKLEAQIWKINLFFGYALRSKNSFVFCSRSKTKYLLRWRTVTFEVPGEVLLHLEKADFDIDRKSDPTVVCP